MHSGWRKVASFTQTKCALLFQFAWGKSIYVFRSFPAKDMAFFPVHHINRYGIRKFLFPSHLLHDSSIEWLFCSTFLEEFGSLFMYGFIEERPVANSFHCQPLNINHAIIILFESTACSPETWEMPEQLYSSYKRALPLLPEQKEHVGRSRALPWQFRPTDLCSFCVLTYTFLFQYQVQTISMRSRACCEEYMAKHYFFCLLKLQNT